MPREAILTALRDLIEETFLEGYEVQASTDPTDPYRERALRLLETEIKAAEALIEAIQLTDTFVHGEM